MLRAPVNLRSEDPLWPAEVAAGLAGDRQDAVATAVGEHYVTALAADEVARADLVLLVALGQML